MNNVGKWVSVAPSSESIIYEGTVAEETSYGIYIYIGGDMSRLSLLPWHTISRVVYTKTDI